MTFSLTANPSSDSWHRVPGKSSKYLENFMSDNDNRKLIQPSLEIQIHGLAAFVTVHKFMCPIHNEAKQMEMSEFWAKKHLLQGHIRRTGGLCSKNPKLPGGFRQSIFKGQVRERNPRVCNLSTAEIIYFLCCTSRHANEEHQTTGSLCFSSLCQQGKMSVPSTHRLVTLLPAVSPACGVPLVTEELSSLP